MLSFKKFLSEDQTQTDEALSVAQRRQKAITMKRYKSKIAIARKRALAKAPTPDQVQKRAVKQARNQVFQKFSKGVARDELTPTARAGIEKRVQKASGLVQRLTKKLLPQIRRLDKERRSGGGKDE